MKIEKEDPGLLLAKESSIVPYIVGIIFIAIGLVALLLPSLFEDPPPFWFGLIFVVFGLLPLILASTTMISIDKAQNKMTVIEKSLIRSRKEECKLEELEAIEVEEGYKIERSSKRGDIKRRITVFALLKNGSRVVLSKTTPASGMLVTFWNVGKRPEIECPKKIAEFANVPLRERRPPSLHDAVSAISKGIEKGMKKD